MKHRWFWVIGAAVVVVVTAGWGGAAEKGIPVFVSILPQKYFVEKIGGGQVAVSVMVPPGASPATYSPKPGQMAAIAGARAYFAVGVPFENAWLKKISAANPRMRIVHTEASIAKMPMASGHGHTAHKPAETAHASGDRHGPSGIPDPHIWLSPPLVTLQARAVLRALQAIDPSHARDYEERYQRFAAEILDLDTRLRRLFAQSAGRRFMVFHPSWGYFAHAYGLVQVPIEIEGKAPKPGQLKQLIEHARDLGIRTIFAQPQFSRASAEAIARAIGGGVVFADPLAYDWAENLERQAIRFRETLK